MKNPQFTIRTPQSGGFTLIEIIVVIVIVGIISTIAAMIILEGAKSYTIEDARSDVQYQARLAMERMAREIRLIRSQADITTMTANNLLYTGIQGDTMRFQLVGTDIMRTQNAVTQRLASGVTALNFTYLMQDGVTTTLVPAQVWYVGINVTFQQDSLQVRTRVHPRNF